MAWGIGGSSSEQKSNSEMNQNVWQPQADAMSTMYGNANNLWQQSMPWMNMGMGMMNQAMPWMTGAAQYGQEGADYMGQGGGYGDTSGMRDNLYASLQDSMNNPSQMGRMYEDIVGGAGNTYVDPLVDSMRQAGDERALTMQSRTGQDASSMGQGGSSRHAMQNAMTNRMVDQDLNASENALRHGAYDTDMNWKMNIAKQADLGRGQAQERAMGALDAGDANRQYGMNYMPTQQNMGMGTMAPWMTGMMAPWQMMASYGSNFGDPTVLTDGSSSSSGSSKAFNAGAGGF